MLTIPILLHDISVHITDTRIAGHDLSRIQGILLMTDDTVPDPSYLYIGTAAQIAAAAARAETAGQVTCFCTGEAFDVTVPRAWNTIFLSLDTINAYNLIYQALHRYQQWINGLTDALHNNQPLQTLLDLGYQYMKAPVMVLNNSYKVLACAIPDDYHDAIIDEMRAHNYLSFATIQAMHKEPLMHSSNPSAHREYINSDDSRYIITRLIRYKGSTVARISVHLPSEEPSPYQTDLSADLAGFISQHLLHNEQTSYLFHNEFSALVADLLDQRLTSPAELEQRLKLMPALAIKKYYHLIVISFENKNASHPWNYIISQLEQVFPYSNSAVYHNEIILLVRKPNHNVRLTFDDGKFTAILETHDAYAAVGNYSKFLTSLHAIYIQTRAAIPLGIVFRTDPKERIFPYEEYSTYHTVALCADTLHLGYHNRNLIYLCHPAIIALDRYDRKYNNDLKDVLYLFLANERNSAKTARELFIHRNTMLYKIRKIEEIIGESLDNVLLRERLLFSFHVLEYIEKFLKEDPLMLKTDREIT